MAAAQYVRRQRTNFDRRAKVSRDDPKFISPAEIARLVGVSGPTAWQWAYEEKRYGLTNGKVTRENFHKAHPNVLDDLMKKAIADFATATLDVPKIVDATLLALQSSTVNSDAQAAELRAHILKHPFVHGTPSSDKKPRPAPIKSE